MLDNSHEAVSPPATNCTIWRYTDLTKFLSILENRKLYLPRIDQFDDPFEGGLSKRTVAILQDPERNGGMPIATANKIISSMKDWRNQIFVSCWFASDHESAAMWKLYLQSPEGVAIKSDHDSLCKALTNSPFSARTTMVKYIDYETEDIPLGNLLYPFGYKRLSFSHEKEVRAVVWSKENINKDQIDNETTMLSIDIDPEELIKAVHVSPTAPKWFGELVEQLIGRYGLQIPVIRSNLYDRPTY